MIDAEQVNEMKEVIEEIPWCYEPTIKEINSLTNLRNTITEYLKFIGVPNENKTDVGHGNETP